MNKHLPENSCATLTFPREYMSFPRGYIAITYLHKGACWSVGTNGQKRSANNKIGISGETAGICEVTVRKYTC